MEGSPAGHPYDRHVGRYGQELAEKLVGFAGVGIGDRVLDVGCGTGQLTAKLADLLGAGLVAAIDPGAGVIDVCRSRVPGADIRIGSAEDLPFDDASFDAALAQLVINLTNDPARSVREMTRVTKPGGVVAACFWDDQEMPLLRSYWDAVSATAPAALSEVDADAQVGLSHPGVLVEWWEQAELVAVEVDEFQASATYKDFDDLWAPFAAGVGHSGSLYVGLDRDQQAALRDDAFKRLGSPRGPFELTALLRAVRGKVPGESRSSDGTQVLWTA